MYFLENKVRQNYGKVFLVDRSDYNTLEVFFDSSFEQVDIRDIVDARPIPVDESKDRFVVQVDRVEVVKSQDFFIKAVEQCEVNMKERIRAIEEGLETKKQEVVVKDDWKELQECKDSEYLRRTVYPLLYPVGCCSLQALQIIERERPNDPLTFISLYLLKNKHLVNLPKKKAPPKPDPEANTKPLDQSQTNLAAPEATTANPQQPSKPPSRAGTAKQK